VSKIYTRVSAHSLATASCNIGARLCKTDQCLLLSSHFWVCCAVQGDSPTSPVANWSTNSAFREPIHVSSSIKCKRKVRTGLRKAERHEQHDASAICLDAFRWVAKSGVPLGHACFAAEAILDSRQEGAWCRFIDGGLKFTPIRLVACCLCSPPTVKASAAQKKLVSRRTLVGWY
jgi:hypothetical protein